MVAFEPHRFGKKKCSMEKYSRYKHIFKSYEKSTNSFQFVNFPSAKIPFSSIGKPSWRRWPECHVKQTRLPPKLLSSIVEGLADQWHSNSSRKAR